MSGAQWPACYEVGVDGVLDGRWSEWFEGLHMHIQDDQAVLSGTLHDQSELHGVLDKVRDQGLSVITVHRSAPGRDRRSAMRRIRVQRPKAKPEGRWLEVLPRDPRDPDLVRVKRLHRRTGRDVMR